MKTNRLIIKLLISLLAIEAGAMLVLEEYIPFLIFIILILIASNELKKLYKTKR